MSAGNTSGRRAPAIGDTVHYREPTSEARGFVTRAAIVVAVCDARHDEDQVVDLHVFRPPRVRRRLERQPYDRTAVSVSISDSGVDYLENVVEGYAAGTWMFRD